MSDTKCYRYIKKINNDRALTSILGADSYLLYNCNNNQLDSCEDISDIGKPIENCYFTNDKNKIISPNKEGYNKSLKYKNNIIHGVLKTKEDSISSIDDLSSTSSDNISTSSISSMDSFSTNNSISTENNLSNSISSIDSVSLDDDYCYKRIERVENRGKIKELLGNDSFRQYTCSSDQLSSCSNVSDIESVLTVRSAIIRIN